MARITLEYNPRNAMARKTLEYILSLGIFKVKSSDKLPTYNPDLVKMIKERDKEPKEKMTREEWRNLMGL